jgi:hypothetical protein
MGLHTALRLGSDRREINPDAREYLLHDECPLAGIGTFGLRGRAVLVVHGEPRRPRGRDVNRAILGPLDKLAVGHAMRKIVAIVRAGPS